MLSVSEFYTLKAFIGAPACDDVFLCHRVSLDSGEEVWFSLLLLTYSLYLLPQSQWLCGLHKAQYQLIYLGQGKSSWDYNSRHLSLRLLGPLCRFGHHRSTVVKPLQVVPWEGLESEDS